MAVARAVQHGAAEFGFTALEEEELDDSCAGASTLSLLIFIAVFFFLLEAAVEHAAALRVELSGLLLVKWMRKEGI